MEAFVEKRSSICCAVLPNNSKNGSISVIFLFLLFTQTIMRVRGVMVVVGDGWKIRKYGRWKTILYELLYDSAGNNVGFSPLGGKRKGDLENDKKIVFWLSIYAQIFYTIFHVIIISNEIGFHILQPLTKHLHHIFYQTHHQKHPPFFLENFFILMQFNVIENFLIR